MPLEDYEALPDISESAQSTATKYDSLPDLEGQGAGTRYDSLPDLESKSPAPATARAVADTAGVRKEEIKAAPTILGEIAEGRFRSAALIAADRTQRMLQPAGVAGRPTGSILGTTEKIPYEKSDSPLATAAKAGVNVGNEFLSGMTSFEGINPVTAVASLPAVAAHQVQRIAEAETTPAYSPERFEAGIGTVALVGLPAAARAGVRPAKGKPVEPARPTEPASVPETVVSETARIAKEGDIYAQKPITETGEIQAGIARQEVAPEVVAIPEYLRTEPEVARLLESPEAQTGPQMRLAEAPESGAIFGSGRKPVTKAVGATPRGDTEFLVIEPALKRVTKGLEREGASDVIGRSRNKVAKILSNATRKHVDTEQELVGQLSSQMERAAKGDRKTTEAAFQELEPFIAAKENGRPLPPISPKAQTLLKAWEDVAEQTGNIAIANNVQVFDPALNSYRPMRNIGRSYIPRMFKREVEQAMRDPQSNAPLWNKMVDEVATQRGISPNDAASVLRKESSRFQANDFMGNLEMARQNKMPEMFYEYDLRNVAARYIPNFSERMGQIIAYGQRLGPRDAPLKPNLWDVAREEAANSYTSDWLRHAEDQAVGLKARTAAQKGAARAQTLASGLLLSGPITVMRNTMSGLTSTAELMGMRRSLRPMIEAATSARSRMNAREIGAIRDNIADFLHADKLGQSFVDDAVRTVTDQSLKYSGYNGSEVFVRTHGALSASQFAKDGVAAIVRKPSSRMSKEALALFKRMGTNAEKIVVEKADWRAGPETRKFIRAVVRESQGGYRFDQVPLWANSNAGRFFYQFGRWGTQRARNIWRNGIKPALGEKVEWHGKTMRRVDPAPLLKMLGGTIVLGETFAVAASTLFDRDRKDSSLTEIKEAWEEDKSKAAGLAFERAVNDIIMAGTLGIWGQPVDFIKGLKDQSRLKNPTEPPGLSSIRALVDLGQNVWDQEGQITNRDILQFTSSLMPQVKQTSDIARNVLDEPLFEAQNDVRTLRGAAQRWARGQGMDVSPKGKGNFRKSEKAPIYEPIKEALLVGDSVTAKVLADDYLNSQPDKKAARKSLIASINQSQPFRAGPYTSEEHRADFMIWARKNLSGKDLQQAQRIQERYVQAAIKAKLSTPPNYSAIKWR